MSYVTLKSLAAEIQTSIDHLVKQFAKVGITKIATDYVTQKEKETLIAYLNQNNNNMIPAPNKLTLQRKTRSTLSISSISGKNKSVQIEVRKKRVYIQHDLYEQIKPIRKQHSDAELLTQHTIQFQNVEKIKCVDKEKNQLNSNIDQLTSVMVGNNKLVNQQIDNVLTQSLKIVSKVSNEISPAESKYKLAEDTCYKIKNKDKQNIKEMQCIVEKHNADWDKLSGLKEIDSNSYYHEVNSCNIRDIESDNNHKKENNRRNRGSKNFKHKKSSRLFNSKTDLEEACVIVCRDKKKRKLNILTQSFCKPTHVVNRNVIIGETITVAELANKMAVKSSQVIKSIMNMGAIATINQVIDQETAQLIAEEMGHKVILRRENEIEESLISDRNAGDSSAVAKSRAPVVTIMGHVDHGKTSLLDCIRSTKVAANEAGNITQHIGAYYVETDNGMITFLDTPGHAAFTAMRARGAQVTDIVVLVVAADDGVMPQTIEAIHHAKASKVPIVVAINKIDKPEANLDSVKNELAKHGIIPDQWGGDSQFVHISAKSGEGINQLLEAILLQSEMLELKAIYEKLASGVVIESFLDKNIGPVATVLVREGTLNIGDIMLCGSEYGRIRAMRSDLGVNIVSACPSMPVEILGLSGVPTSGDEAIVVHDERKAREVALYRQGKFREIKLAARRQDSKINNVLFSPNKGNVPELNIVLKSNLQGSIEAIKDALERLSNDKTKIQIVYSGVGSITETDATLASTSNAMLLGFNVRADVSARRVIEEERLDLRYYAVIYDLINDIKYLMGDMLLPEYKQKIIGLAEVRNVFRSPKFGAIAGCIVLEGIVKRHNKIRVLRENASIYEGELESLRRFKSDTNEVRSGMECGIGIKNYNNIKLGDIIEVFETVEIKQTIV